VLAEGSQFLKTLGKVLLEKNQKKYLVLRMWFESCWHLCGTVCWFTVPPENHGELPAAMLKLI